MQDEDTTSVVCFLKTRITSLIIKKKSDKHKLRDILQNISTLQNYLGHEKQGKTEETVTVQRKFEETQYLNKM